MKPAAPVTKSLMALMFAEGTPPGNGTAVELPSCRVDGSQMWLSIGGGGLYAHAQVGRCLETPESGVLAGTPLQIGGCTIGAGRQLGRIG